MPPAQPTRIAFIGCGEIANKHAVLLRAAGAVELVAVSDIHQQRAESFANEYGVPAHYSDAAAMIASEQPDVVHVLTPAHLHVAPVEGAMSSGCDVFIEKPLAISLSECRSLERLCAESGVYARVNHQLVHNPVFEELVDLIKARRFGRVNHVSVLFAVSADNLRSLPSGHFVFQDPRNAVLEFGVHPLALIQRLMGAVEDCSAMASREVGGVLSHWQISYTCARGTADLTLLIGRGGKQTLMTVSGEDASAMLDVDRQTLVLQAPSPRPVFGGLLDAWREARRMLSSAGSGVAAHYQQAIGSKAGLQRRDPFARSIAAFYRERQRRAPDALRDAREIIEYCDAAAMKLERRMATYA